MNKVFALYEKKGGKLKKMHEGSYFNSRIFNDFLGPQEGESQFVLLSGREEELLHLMTMQEIEQKGLMYRPEKLLLK